MENLQKVNCSIIGEIKFRGKKSVLSTGKPVGQDQKHKVGMKGLQTEYLCQKKIKQQNKQQRRVWLFIQARGNPEHCRLVWHCYEDQAGGQPQCHATSVMCACNNFHNTSRKWEQRGSLHGGYLEYLPQ